MRRRHLAVLIGMGDQLGWVTMSERERRRTEALARVDDGRLSVEVGQSVLGLDPEQPFRPVTWDRAEGGRRCDTGRATGARQPPPPGQAGLRSGSDPGEPCRVQTISKVGGVPPLRLGRPLRPPLGRYLSFAAREGIDDPARPGARGPQRRPRARPCTVDDPAQAARVGAAIGA